MNAIVLACCLLLWPLLAWADGKAITPVADVTVTSSATLVKDRNAFRVSLSCTNTSATVNVRWGDSGVTVTTGQQLRAGNAIEINNSAPIYMISEGANVTVSCTEETK